MRNMSQFKFPMIIGKCVEWVIRVCLIVCWISRIMCLLCMFVYEWISVMGLRCLLAIVVICR